MNPPRGLTKSRLPPRIQFEVNTSQNYTLALYIIPNTGRRNAAPQIFALCKSLVWEIKILNFSVTNPNRNKTMRNTILAEQLN